MQRILFPTDFSENSWNAIAYAFEFFRGTSCHFHFLHVGFHTAVQSDVDLNTQGISLRTIIPQGDSSNYSDLLSRIENNFPNHKHKITTHFEANLFIESIRKYIKSHQIELVVMGTKGASGSKAVILGSHAGAVITRVKCPALIIPEQASFVAPIDIVFPTDFNMAYKDRIFKTLKDFSGYYNSTLHVLRVARNEGNLEIEQYQNKELLEDEFSGLPHSFHWIQSPELESGLQTFIDSMGIQLITMVGKNLNFFQRLFFKPGVVKISYHTRIPFLVLHE